MSWTSWRPVAGKPHRMALPGLPGCSAPIHAAPGLPEYVGYRGTDRLKGLRQQPSAEPDIDPFGVPALRPSGRRAFQCLRDD